MIRVKLNPYYKTREITLKAEFTKATNGFEMTYILSGELDKVVLPALSNNASRKDELWKKTCLECFIRDHKSENYIEFNFSPSGDYNAYQFSGVRDGMMNLDALNIDVAVEKSREDRVILKANVEFSDGAPFDFENGLLGICAVTEHADKMEYWAIHHPASGPDFHDPEGFILKI